MVGKHTNQKAPCSASALVVPRGEIYSFVPGRRMEFPLHLCGVSAGFSSPAEHGWITSAVDSY